MLKSKPLEFNKTLPQSIIGSTPQEKDEDYSRDPVPIAINGDDIMNDPTSIDKDMNATGQLFLNKEERSGLVVDVSYVDREQPNRIMKAICFCFIIVVIGMAFPLPIITNLTKEKEILTSKEVLATLETKPYNLVIE